MKGDESRTKGKCVHGAPQVDATKSVARETGEGIRSGEQQTDDGIAQRAARAITWDAMIPRGRVHVEVVQGWVTLTGRVGWPFQRKAAEGAVRLLSGARGDSNLIEVETSASTESCVNGRALRLSLTSGSGLTGHDKKRDWESVRGAGSGIVLSSGPEMFLVSFMAED
ncbi:MAG: BON domain-containing protein [Pigmentiphaga sp.]|uniref:BON domain-containing protein n=1 Tax=Pigmentiphaga sp. TaxID=1977564 RepID=UPI003B5467B5